MSCRQVAGLISRDEIPALRWWQRAEIRMHLIMCVHCRRYATQMRAIGDGIRRLFDVSTPNEEETVRELERRILDDRPSTK